MKLDEAKEMIRQFEACTLPKEQWTHKAHFFMALWYCFHQPLPIAMQSIKNGIKKHNLSLGKTNTDDSGYHETITLFNTRLIVNYLLQTSHLNHFETAMAALENQCFLAKNFSLKYYSEELLMSKEARRNWIAPDKQAIDLLGKDNTM